jgi:hypothetical protein
MNTEEPPERHCSCGAKINHPHAPMCQACNYQAKIEHSERLANEAEYWREYAETHEGPMRKRFNLDHYDGRNRE